MSYLTIKLTKQTSVRRVLLDPNAKDIISVLAKIVDAYGEQSRFTPDEFSIWAVVRNANPGVIADAMERYQRREIGECFEQQ